MSDTSRLGRYEIRREIARSNDIVYEAFDTLLGRRVALKELVLPPNLDGNARRDRVERFYREARAAGALSHRGIVTLYEVGEDHGRHFIAMEYLEGQTLRHTLDLRGALSLAETERILVQVLDALAYAHAHGVVHRDIKPDNVYLLADGTVKLTDFGIARIMDEPSLTSAGQVFGTPSYMSPEQISGKPVDERTDLYSTGIMAYELISGRKPFVGDGVVALTYQIINVDPATPPGVSPAVGRFLQVAMDRDPARRFQTALGMSSALVDAVRDGTATIAPPMPQGSVPTTGPARGAPAPVFDPATVVRRRRVPISHDQRQFLTAVAVGAAVAGILIALVFGVRSGYRQFVNQSREQAALTIYTHGDQLYRSGSFDQAAGEFQRVIRNAPGTELAKHAQQSETDCYLSIGDADMGHDLNAAETAYEAAVRVSPNRADAWLRLGDVLERMGDFSHAISTWERCAQLDGFGDTGMQARRQQSMAWYNRGVDEFNVGHQETARQYWQRSIDADPSSPSAQLAQQQIDQHLPSPYPGP